MTVAIPILVVFFALMVWGLALAVLRRRSLLRETAAAHQRCDNALQQRLHMLGLRAEAIAENGSDTDADRASLIEGKTRAMAYLRRIVALTGATQTDNGYVLDVGRKRFQVRDRFVRRLRDSANPEAGYDETCFYSVHKNMPRAEETATVLLQLKNNPELFDKWAMQNGLAFKSDGEVFTHI